jgi:hypothetical protein
MIGRISGDVKRSGWVLLTMLLVTFSMSWVLLRKRSERLFQLPSQLDLRLMGIQNEEALFIGRDGGASVQLRARSLKTGKTRTIATEESLRNGYSPHLTDDALYFKVASKGEITPPGISIAPQNSVSGLQTPPLPAGSLGMSIGGGRAGLSPGGPARMPSPAVGIPPPTASMGLGGLGGLSLSSAALAPIGAAATPPPRPEPSPPLDGAGDPPGSPNLNPELPSSVALRRVDLRSGQAKDLSVPLARNPFLQRDYIVLGGTVYFSRFTVSPPPRTDAPLSKRKACSVELLSCPANGGEVSVLARVPGLLSTLYKFEKRVFWIVARPENPGRVDLYHLADGETKVQIIRNYMSWLPPVEAGGRLFWITRNYVSRNLELSGVSLETSNLESARLDGTDRLIVTRITERGQYLIHMWRPMAHKNRVYAHVSEPATDEDGADRKQALYRVRSDLRGLERVRDLPSKAGARGAFVQDGWYYISLHDRRQSLWDYLRHGEREDYTEVLHRVRLPDN